MNHRIIMAWSQADFSADGLEWEVPGLVNMAQLKRSY
jgi:hypothetical protein